MRPDYFFASIDPHGTAEVWAVECKGSHSPTLWSSQLRTAASQVANVFVDGNPPPALLFATYLHRSEITVRVLDPPSDKWRGEYAREESGDPPFSLETSAGGSPTWIIARPEQFRSDLALVNASAALAFAGAYGAAGEALPRYTRRGRELPPLGDEPQDEIEGFDRTFIGTTSTLPVRSDLTVEVFTGVERSLYDASVRRDVDYLMARRAEADAAADDDAQPSRVETDFETFMRTVDADGTFFEVRARER
jgi:hypothetical protein